LDVDITKLVDRDSQEVVGYFNTHDLISESWKEIDITENSLKFLHQTLLRFSQKDDWHRGEYKQHSNAVEARMPDGTSQTNFQTTLPGFPTQDAMGALINWYTKDQQTHPLVKCALFCYEFVTIHPFQDGNGRLSRLLATLLLLKHKYAWIEYVSFEHEIESRKAEYYRVLRSCQAGRPNEDVTEWVAFFFDALVNIQQSLTEKLNITGVIATLSPRDKAIITFIENHPGSRSGVIGEQLNIPSPTVKKTLAELVAKKLLKKKYPYDRIIEEVILPGTNNLRADFFLPNRKLVVEVHGSQHVEFNNFFFKDKFAYYKSKARDAKKRNWCQLNDIAIVELFHYESPEQWDEKL
jgi:Fic family protein